MLITTDNDYKIVNATLKNISVHPAGAYLQYSVPGNLIDADYAKYLEVEKFLLVNNLIQLQGASGRVILTTTGESIIENYQGDVKKYLNQISIEKKKKKYNWSVIWAIIGTIIAVIGIIIDYLK